MCVSVHVSVWVPDLTASSPTQSAPSQQLYGVAVYNNSIYWDDRQDGSLHRAFFDSTHATASTGTDERVLLTNMAIDVREVRLIKKSDIADRGRWVCGPMFV